MRSFVFLFISLIWLASCSTTKKAKKAFRLGKYQNAIDLYKKVLAGNPNNREANYFVAESYRQSNRIKESEAFYAKGGGGGVDPDTVSFYYAQALKSNGKYDEAKKQYEALIKSTDNNPLKDRAQAELKGLDYLGKLN